MKAKRSVAVLSVTGIAVVTVVTGIDLFSSAGSSSASGRAELAVVNSEKAQAVPQPTQKLVTEQDQAEEAVRIRNQLEARAMEMQSSQDAAARVRMAKNAATARYQALQKTDRSSREERASRDAERKKFEGTPKQIAMNLLPDHGWSQGQFSCLEKLWNKESRWNPRADNPTSSAYGIAQALPGNRMASYGADWRTNPVVQIKWGLDYIEDRYGSPCSAWGHSQAKGWY